MTRKELSEYLISEGVERYVADSTQVDYAFDDLSEDFTKEDILDLCPEFKAEIDKEHNDWEDTKRSINDNWHRS